MTVTAAFRDSRKAQLPHPLLWPLAALGTVIGWTVGRTPLAIGWTAGRAFLIGAYFIEAVIYGFRQGAQLGPKVLPEAAKDAGRT
jgi:hypothetical protein